jgi:lipid II:glycine glycyltransferase (peptidoglycan interpeptide bridge formation enzyme)
VYGWYGGLNRAFSSYSPNEIMMWHILEWGAKNGYRCYDFGGAGKPDVEYGVRDFKAKFGGTQVSFGRNVYVHKPFLMGIAELGYNFVRRFF